MNHNSRHYARMLLIPLGIGGGLAILNHNLLHFYVAEQASAEFFLNSIMGVSSTLIGILLTVLALVYGLPDNKIIEDLRKSNHILELPYSTLLSLVYWFVLFVTCTYIGVGHLTEMGFTVLLGAIAGFFTSTMHSLLIFGITIWTISTEDEREKRKKGSVPPGPYRIGKDK